MTTRGTGGSTPPPSPARPVGPRATPPIPPERAPRPADPPRGPPAAARPARPPVVMPGASGWAEPIAYDAQDARARLAGIADLFLIHDRPIAIRCDASVPRVVAGAELPLRRSRGHAPAPFRLPG